MLELRQIKLPVNHDAQDIESAIIANLCLSNIFGKTIPQFDYSVIRKSIDARKKPSLYFIYSVCVDFKDAKTDKRILAYLGKRRKSSADVLLYEPVVFTPTSYKKFDALSKRPIVIGTGPAGLFAAYILALSGLKPLILERGECVEERQKSVNAFWNGGKLNTESNVQFGEGGAGTFSDGKLNTLTKDKFGIQSFILKTFVEHGAPEKIIYDAKPHIGTDILAGVVVSMREEIIRLGGEYRFNAKVTDFCVANDKISGVIASGSDEPLKSDHIILAIGHSSRDTFVKLKECGVNLEQKSFAMGFRLRHPQRLINKSQYGYEHNPYLEAADYKVAATSSNGKRIYSFCMCPGGYIVNASSETERICVNGMSYSARDGQYANSAIIVGIDTIDFPPQKGCSSDDPLLGMYYQMELERKAYDLGNGAIPVQPYRDFAKRVLNQNNDGSESTEDFLNAVKGTCKNADLTEIFDNGINEAFVECMERFGRSINGFDSDDAVMYGVEARTSSPVRILRDENFMSNIKGLYPCGEGAGYAGGIMSAAVDGVKVAMSIIDKIGALS